MPSIIEITDLNAPELAVFTRLTESQLRSRREAEKAVFIAESVKVIELALRAGCEPISFLMERRHITGKAQNMLSQQADVPVYTAESALLEQLTGFQLSRGVLCAMRRPRQPDVAALCTAARRIAVLEDITDAANVGAVFRSAAALGMDAVLVTPSCCDVLNRRAVRVSMGAVFQVPWTQIGPWPHPAMETLKEMGFQIAALALSDTAVSIDDPHLMEEEKLAILLGTEGTGLSPDTIAACDYHARIPMAHQVDSLNVAAASAVAFWQLRGRS
ncbi:MAG: RNA methyltransferase [Clostridiales bacterium]|nr:RNA methyltransferase [Clostridiales bacterium]